jgi:murein tripeptide amidase MpaA
MMQVHSAARLGLGLLLFPALAGAQPDAIRATEPVTRFDGHRVVRVQPRTTRELRTALALTDDIWTHTVRSGQPIEFRVSPEQFAALAGSGVPYEILDHNLQATLDRESAAIRALREADGPGWYDNYHNYADVKTYVQNLAATYPNLATYQVIGQSLQNREIFALRITGPGSAANRPQSLWWGGQHAREWINIPVPVYHAEQLLIRYATDPQIRQLVDNVEFIFVPTMNPDGYEYSWTNNRMWRKNRRNNSGSGTGCNNFGVDLNRNWGYQWGALPQGGSSGSCNSETYRGTAPFSEPETQVMRDFIVANPRIVTTMDWHSYGQLVMSPWGYTEAPPSPAAVANQFQTLNVAMADAILAVHGQVYDPGPIGPTLYIANGCSVDWSFGDRNIWGFTIELRDNGQNGFVLPPDQIIPTCEETWPAFLVLAQFAAPGACYANCDGSTVVPILNVNDFVCFQSQFAAGSSAANCDNSSVPPVLNVNDFVCFQASFAAGCK